MTGLSRRRGLRRQQWFVLIIGGLLLSPLVLFPPVLVPGWLLGDGVEYRWFRAPLFNADDELRPMVGLEWTQIVFVVATTAIVCALFGRRAPNREQRSALWTSGAVAILGSFSRLAICPFLSPYLLQDTFVWLDVIALCLAGVLLRFRR